MRQLIIATKNKGKAKEFSDLFSPYNLQVKTLLDIPPSINIEETGSTFIENACLKAEQTRKVLNTHVLADDSGLVVDALGGAPGIYSARYAGENATDQSNIDKLLEALKSVPEAKRTARFVAVIALALKSGETIFREGICEGKIAFNQAGGYGFGYDPIFIPDGYDETMAELKPNVKNKISHRKHALDQLGQWLKANEHLL